MVINSDLHPTSEHNRKYNGPHSSEIAAIITGVQDDTIEWQYIVVCRRRELNATFSERFGTVPLTHRSQNPVSYIILLPHDTDGWHLRLLLQCSSSSKRQSAHMVFLVFQAYPLFRKSSQFSPVLRGSSLSQPYVIGQLCKIELKRLKRLQHNHMSLRAADQASLSSSLETLKALNTKSMLFDRIGSKLSSTYVSDDRYVQQNLHNIVSISGMVVYSNNFLTLSCNPQRPDTKNSWLLRQSVIGRLDIAAPVFSIELSAPSACITDELVLGKVEVCDGVTTF